MEYYNLLFLFLLLTILIYFLENKKPLENFTPGIFGFDPKTIHHSESNPYQNYLRGTYARTQIYQNVCQPDYGLNRQKIPLEDNCQRTFRDYMSTPTHYYICDTNKHLQRNCRWYKK